MFEEMLRKNTFLNTSEYSKEMLNPWSLRRQMSDQIALLKAYTVIAIETGNISLSSEMESTIRSTQLLLSKAATRGVTVTKSQAEGAISKMSLLIYKAVELRYDSAVQLVKLRGMVTQQEEIAKAATVKASFFSQMAAEGISKGLHCLEMTLTAQWNAKLNTDAQSNHYLQDQVFKDPSMHHFAVISDNVLAVGALVNSTVLNSLRPELIVFHITTASSTVSAMQMWFVLHPPGKAYVEIQDIGALTWLNSSYSPVLRQMENSSVQEYYFRAPLEEPSNQLKFRNPKYLSMMNHLRFYLPEMYPELDRIIFLDDDVIVRKDLSSLFSLDLRGNVHGAVETCLETFHRFYSYLNFSNPLIRDSFDPYGCSWAFGMNVFDLNSWRHHSLTQTYHFWQERNLDHSLWKLGTLPPGLLTFYGLTLPLERSWHVLGLGFNDKLDEEAINKAAVLHWNGNMKPWLKLAIRRYKHLWDLYVDFSDVNLQRCNVH